MSSAKWAIAAAAAGVISILPAARAPAQTTQPAGTSTYTATFTPLNNSNVAGTADLTLNGSTLTVNLNATGLEPSQNHPQHIHGFADNTPSQIPAFPPDPTVDTNANGLLDDPEAELFVGPPILGLTGTNSTGNANPTGSGEPGGVGLPSVTPTDYPAADAAGNINYSGTFTVDSTLFADLTLRTLEIHGLTVNGTYDATLPVAAAPITLVSNGGGGGTGGGGGGTGGGTGGGGGGGGGAGGTPIPLPAGIFGGAYLLSGLAGTSFLKKRFRRR